MPQLPSAEHYPHLARLGIHVLVVDDWPTALVLHDEMARVRRETAGLDAYLEQTGPHIHTSYKAGLYAYDIEEMVRGFPSP